VVWRSEASGAFTSGAACDVCVCVCVSGVCVCGWGVRADIMFNVCSVVTTVRHAARPRAGEPAYATQEKERGCVGVERARDER